MNTHFFIPARENQIYTQLSKQGRNIVKLLQIFVHSPAHSQSNPSESCYLQLNSCQVERLEIKSSRNEVISALFCSSLFFTTFERNFQRQGNLLHAIREIKQSRRSCDTINCMGKLFSRVDRKCNTRSIRLFGLSMLSWFPEDFDEDLEFK